MRRIGTIIDIVLTALLCVAVTSWPKNMSVSLAGFSLEATTLTNVAWHDPKTGWFAHKGWDCDGSHRSIRLTKDRRILQAVGYDLTRFGRGGKGYDEVKEHPFNAVSRLGIAPGTSQATVLAKLGKPTRFKPEGSRFTCAMYKKIAPGQVLRNIYIFKDKKLIEMLYMLDSVPGCGEDDSLSDEGWPWTTF